MFKTDICKWFALPSRIPRPTGCSRVAMGVAVVVLGAGMASAEVPVHPAEPLGTFIRTWLLCGPFHPAKKAGAEALASGGHVPGFYTDHLEAHGGEASARIEEGQVESYDGESATWVLHRATGDRIDLDSAISKREPAMAYAYCIVESQRELACLLAVGSNDGVRVWLNGEEVLDAPGGRTLRVDADLVPIVVREGRNTLLLKVDEHGNIWEFCCRLLSFDYPGVGGRFRLFQVENDEAGAALLRCVAPESLLSGIVERATLEVSSAEEPGAILWRGEWQGGLVQPIGVDAARYGEYTLRVATTFRGGVEQTMETPFTAGERIEYTLFADGATDYSILLGPDASESERWAAQELQHWIKELSGAEFPIEETLKEPKDQAIVLGFNACAQGLLGPDAAQPGDGDEAFTYKNIGPAIAIWGGKDRGTMYGVMTFLERELGCRWYTPTVSVAPKKDRFVFHYLNHTESPGIRVRNDFYFEAFEPIWAAHNKVNGAMSYREQPGGLECYWAVHTFYHFMPPDEFFDDHPEYYSLIDGKRVHDHAQLCLTNPDVLQIVTERVKQVMRDQPEYLIYSVSQNDWHQPCQCDKCQAIVEREGSESGPLIRFVNQVAEAVEAEFPDKFIGTLAYTYTRTPCKTIQPRHNVVIRLCSIECCFAHDFHHCPENESFVKDLEGWAAISPHLYIWDYVVNFSHYIMPYPNFHVLRANIQTFRDNKAIGIMEQAAYQSRGGEFAELRAYVIAKLLWDPECDVEALINDFMYGYYGRSGQYVRCYFDLLHGRLTPDTHIHLGLQPDDTLFSDDFVREAEALFDRAETVADNEAVRRRVEMVRLPLMYLKCKRMPAEARRDGTYARFTAITEREGVIHYAEAGAPHREAFHKEMQDTR